jgi:hypothetical protein
MRSPAMSDRAHTSGPTDRGEPGGLSDRRSMCVAVADGCLSARRA